MQDDAVLPTFGYAPPTAPEGGPRRAPSDRFAGDAWPKHMMVRLLGPFEVGTGPTPARIPAGKPRSLLAALAVNAGTVVGVDALTVTLWGDSPPASAAKQLQIYVSQLRKLLPAPEALVTRAPGYLLDVVPDAVDVGRFAQLVAAGSRARSVGAPHDAAALLGEALGLWRGDPLLDVGPAAMFDDEAARLSALRLRALEDWYAVRIELGEAAEVVEAVQALAAEHPLREGVHESLVLALYLTGRQADALSAYERVRTALLDELGLDPGHALRELHGRLLRQEPDLAAVAPQRVSRLPMPLTPTIGREAELAQLRGLLQDRGNRLVTLIGPGGSGKTRLATVAAAQAADSYPGGAVLVALEAVREPALALMTLAAAVGVRETGADPVAAMARELHRRELLVVLDNLEQVVGVAPELARLLALAPGLTFLVTSRVVLAVMGERAFPVPPLGLPAVGRSAQDSPAVSLFCDRAGAASSSFALSESNAADIAELCRRLDGLPLAIELAAAQSRVLSPGQLLQRLRSRLDAPGPGQRDRPARHQSLRSALDGSHELLGPAARELFAALSVFAGGCELAAAEAVCRATPDALAELVDHSLVHVSGQPELRFRLLETVREYAAELQAAEADGELHSRHAAYYLALARRANLDAGRLTAAPTEHDEVLKEQDNLRAALSWAQRSHAVAVGLDIATALEFFWSAHDPREGMRWFRALLEPARAAAVDQALLAHGLRAYGTSADIAGEDRAATELYEQSLAIFERLGDDRGRAVLLHRLGVQAMRRGELTVARDLVESSQQLIEQQSEPFARLWVQVQTTGTLGAIQREASDAAAACDLLARSCALAREVGMRWWEAMTSAELAAVLLTLGRNEEAARYARDCLLIAQEPFSKVLAVGVMAGVAADQGQHERAGQLWGTVEHEDAVSPLGGWRRFQPECAMHVQAAAGSAFDRGQAVGRAQTLDQAVAFALEAPGGR